MSSPGSLIVFRLFSSFAKAGNTSGRPPASTLSLVWKGAFGAGNQLLTIRYPNKPATDQIGDVVKIPRYTRQDGIIRLIVLPLFVLAENWILLGNSYWADWRVFVFTTLVMMLSIYFHWFINNAISLYFHQLYPHYQQLFRRMVPNVLLLCLNSCLFTFLAYRCFRLVDLPHYQPQPERLVWGLSFVVLTVFLVSTIYETINYLEQWQQVIVETERLKKVNLQTKLDALKSQINPHFLFNSLNSLSSLIEDNPAQAEQFVDEMSSVYRYLLRSNETELVTLETEMAFVQSYFHLLQTRYGTHIQLKLAVDAQYYDYQLPSLTLQLLLENAVKHNVMLAQQPLCISIETVADQLVVRNNLQRKTTRVLSNQVGLANIAAKYQLLGAGEVGVYDDDCFFTVTLPLIGRS